MPPTRSVKARRDSPPCGAGVGIGHPGADGVGVRRRGPPQACSARASVAGSRTRRGADRAAAPASPWPPRTVCAAAGATGCDSTSPGVGDQGVRTAPPPGRAASPRSRRAAPSAGKAKVRVARGGRVPDEQQAFSRCRCRVRIGAGLRGISRPVRVRRAVAAERVPRLPGPYCVLDHSGATVPDSHRVPRAATRLAAALLFPARPVPVLARSTPVPADHLPRLPGFDAFPGRRARRRARAAGAIRRRRATRSIGPSPSAATSAGSAPTRSVRTSCAGSSGPPTRRPRWASCSRGA